MNKIDEVMQKHLWPLSFKIKRRFHLDNYYALHVSASVTTHGIENAHKHGIECSFVADKYGNAVHMITYMHKYDETDICNMFNSFLEVISQ